ncbi:acid phosphatase [Gluconobacter morbifer]|uniref:Acid phosphatase n=1 Tax=Gluconobacter morbifer G707 TaxID=1088869 RepID=G6XFQ4_9PROT|nr:phosphatase PAP2 family protein [Gluconobacter morbifer]EHH69012.1 nonspecific acid phosphatase precursor [Gluconobacter morbifer G707]
MKSSITLSTALLFCVTVLAGCSVQPRHDMQPARSVAPLTIAAPDERQVLPPPPAMGSAAQADDERIFRQTRALRDTPRWQLAQRDAELDQARLVGDFSCAAGFTIELARAPHLKTVLDRLRPAIGRRTSEAKHYWHRTRPFVAINLPICTSPDGLGPHASYPSGHTTAGYGMALLLARLLPEHATAFLQRGRVFGESRIVCGAHWKSDVQAGFLNASSLMDTLLSDPALQDDLTAARRELLAQASSPSAPDAATCAVEEDAAAHSILSE